MDEEDEEEEEEGEGRSEKGLRMKSSLKALLGS